MLPLEVAIAPSLKSAGFKKKARTWWRSRAAVIQVINIQKSAYGERLYINLGIYVKQFGTEQTPPENRCHVQARLERVSDPARQPDVERAASSTVPSAALVEAILTDGLAWLDRLSTLQGIRSYLEHGGANKGLVLAAVRKLAAEAE